MGKRIAKEETRTYREIIDRNEIRCGKRKTIGEGKKMKILGG